MQQKSNFSSDIKLSNVFGDFLDEHFYKPMESLITEKGPDAAKISFERVYDRERQMRGFDVIMHEGEWTLPIDEKAQLAYMDDPRDTFCLELSYLKHSEPMPGWLLDEAKRTAAYLLCWPKGPKGVKGVFTGADMMLVYSKHVKSFLERWGFNHEVLAHREQLIREGRLLGRQHTKCPGFWFALSPKLAEEPVNVIFQAELLKQLASANIHLEVDPATGENLISGTWLGQEINTVHAA